MFGVAHPAHAGACSALFSSRLVPAFASRDVALHALRPLYPEVLLLHAFDNRAPAEVLGESASHQTCE